jgi:hypothetical protein
MVFESGLKLCAAKICKKLSTSVTFGNLFMRALMTFRITSITREHFYRSSFKVSFKKFQELGHNHLKLIIKPKSPMGRDVDIVFLQEVILFFEIFFLYF